MRAAMAVTVRRMCELLLNAGNPGDRHGRQQRLPSHWRVGVLVGRLLLDTTDAVEAFHDAAERRRSLPVVETLAAEVERRLIVEADEEVRSRGVGLDGPRHRDDSRDVLQAGDAGALERDRIEAFAPPFRIDPRLDDFHG